MSSPAPLGMFIIGFIIFALYLWGLLTMIYRSHRQQRRELENDPELRHSKTSAKASQEAVVDTTNFMCLYHE